MVNATLFSGIWIWIFVNFYIALKGCQKITSLDLRCSIPLRCSKMNFFFIEMLLFNVNVLLSDVVLSMSFEFKDARVAK